MAKDCIFCKIIEGKMPCEKIYEDEETFAFLDISPVNHGHTLIIPKKHARNVFDISEKDFLSVMRTVRKLAPIIKEATKADGENVVMSNEKAGNQEVFHLHVHIIPRYNGDHKSKGFVYEKYKEGEMEKVAKKIKANL